MTVTLELDEWQKIMAVLAQAPWAVANPLLMKIGDQLRQQTPRPNGPDPEPVNKGLTQ